MEIGGLVVFVYEAFLGNPDVMTILLGWAVIVTITFVTIRIYEDLS
ncbi:hypothetical protein ACQYAD_08570 [Neobacillus sp. SM06]